MTYRGPVEATAVVNHRLDEWQTKLISLDRRQRLVYFKHTKTSSLELLTSAAAAEAGLRRSKGMELIPEVLDESDEDASGTRTPKMVAHDAVLVRGKSTADVGAAVRSLVRASTTAFVDRGVWVLYAGLGMATWVDDQQGDPVESPLLLVPVRIVAGGQTGGPRVVATADDPQVNPSLIAKLDRDFGIDLSGIDSDLSADEVMAAVARRLPTTKGWGVQDRSVVAPFSFHKEAMYRDLNNNRDKLVSHDLIQLLTLGPESTAFADAQFEPVADDSIDESPPPEELFTILDADSSQRQCLLAALDGRSFVMDGPPGTGKSQTIANIIAELIYRGKSVLFVSEKAAALDVVRNRLDDAELAPFILELHSHHATRKSIAQNLGAALSSRPSASSVFGATQLQRLATSRRELSAYAQAMNECRRPLERSLHDVLGVLGPLAQHRVFTLMSPGKWRDLSAERFALIEDLATRMSLAWKPIEQREDFLWTDIVAGTATAPQVQELRGLTDNCLTAAQRLRSASVEAARDLCMDPPPDADKAAELASTVGVLEERPRSWHGTSEAELAQTLAIWLMQDSTLPIGDAVERCRAALTRVVVTAESLHSHLGRSTPPSPADAAVLQTCGDVVTDREPALKLQADATCQSAQAAAAVVAVLRTHLGDVHESATYLAATFGVDQARIGPARSGEMARLAHLASSPDRPEPTWFNPALHQQLQCSHATLQQLVSAVNERHARLSAVFTDEALSLPLDQISVRVHANGGLRRLSRQSRDDRRALKAVTVQARVDSDVIALLAEAAAWQQADRALREAEPMLAGSAGHYYQGTATDFARLGRALQTAQQAVELARDELDPDRLARQLSISGQPDPTIHMHAARVTSFEQYWGGSVAGTFGTDFARRLAQLPFQDLSGWLRTAATNLDRMLAPWHDLDSSTGRAFTVAQARAAGEAAGDFHAAEHRLASERDTQAAALGCFGAGSGEALDRADEAVGWVEQVRSRFPAPITAEQVVRVLNPAVAHGTLADAVSAYGKTTRELTLRFAAQRRAELESDFRNLDAGISLLESMRDSADLQVPMWVDHTARRAALDLEGLGGLLELMVEQEVAADVIPDIARFAVLSAWVSCVQEDDSRLALYATDLRNGQAHNFKQLDRDFVRTRAAGVINAAAARRPKVIGGPAGLIQKESQKRARHLPIRDLLARTREVALAVKPCFMMSPLAVSQYLPPDIEFDVVIFDEASQVLPEDAANCIYRGRQLIVAGDQNQLPPTDFFRSGTTEDIETVEEDYGPDDFQSLLDLCKAQGLKSLPLTWHYRSRHEDLITFSNYRFYKGILKTFPGASKTAPDLGVESFLVDGLYRRGAQRDNPVEAEAVVDRVLFHLHHHPESSIGVVAFSAAQEDAVLAALEARTQVNPELLELLHNEDRLAGFFVKNLENVQGDERDTIVFTVGYGPDEAGKFLLNLGPLVREGGWRRLNVAITRACKRVEIVHSVRPEDFPPGASEGVRALRQYLDYAIRGPSSLAIDVKDSLGEAESPFEEDVLRTVRSWGYEAVPQVGTAGYRLDMGIVHPDHPGRYILAVECDGAAYHSAKAARDRDRIREQVLTGLGWKVHRIWGLSWYRDRHTQENRLREAIEGALRREGEPLEKSHDIGGASVAVSTEIVDHLGIPDWAQPFLPPEAIAVDRRWRGSGGITDPHARPELVDYICQVVLANTPIHVDLLRERIRQDWEISRAGSNIQSSIDAAIDIFLRRNPSCSQRGDFLRDANRPLRRVGVGIGGGIVRSAAHVPPEEMDMAVQATIDDAQVIAFNEVKQYVKALFGWSRLGAEIDAALAQSRRRLVADRHITENKDGTVSSTGR